VKREDWTGAISLEPLNLPANVQATAGILDKTVDTVPMVFEAAADAPLAQKLFTFTGAPAEPIEGTQPAFRVEHVVNVCENGNQRPFYTIKQYDLPVAVTEPIPAKIEVQAPATPAMRGSQFPLKVKVERTGEFKGQVDVTLLYAPPGIATSGLVKVAPDAKEALDGFKAPAAESNAYRWLRHLVEMLQEGESGRSFTTSCTSLSKLNPPWSVVRTRMV
jgi:hypothetical protein